MLSTIHKGVGGVFRVTGQALDAIGQRLEVNPFVERCKKTHNLTHIYHTSNQICIL